MEIIDSPVEIRKGEGFNSEKLKDYLKSQIPGIGETITVKQFPGGFSNLTYLIGSNDSEFVLRRPPFGNKAKTAHDMSREYKILSALKSVYPYCPEPYLYCDDPEIMDSPFYVMERMKGIILRKDLPPEMGATPDDDRKLSENLIKVFCELHSVDYHSIGLGDFGKPEGYVKRQVDGWSRRYINSMTDDAPGFEGVMTWLSDKMPEDTDRPAVIHNDYKFDNVVLDPSEPLHIIGVLDWEMATIGDPLMDLGNSLAYWVNKDDPPALQMIRQMPTNAEGMLSRDELVTLYGELTGRSVENFDYYYCFGLFRLAVIAQQIYYRFYHGQTSDERFRLLIGAVKILEKVASDVIESSDI